VVRSREEPKAVTNAHNIGIADQEVLFPRPNLVQVAVGADWRRWHTPDLLPGHLLLVDLVMNAVDLDLELQFVGLLGWCGLGFGHRCPLGMACVQPWYHEAVVLDKLAPGCQDASMQAPKAMTIRLSADQAEALETIASVDDKAVVEVIRSAIDAHVRARSEDAEFQRNLQARLERVQAILRPSP
jgi:hypothetical protein